MDPITILIQSQNEARETLRETRRELQALRQDFPAIQSAAAGASGALDGVGQSLLTIARAGAEQGVDLRGTLERIAEGGEMGEQALRDFAQVADQVAPEAARQLAADLDEATAAVLDMVRASGAGESSGQTLARAMEAVSEAGAEAADNSRSAARATQDEARGNEQAARSAESKATAEEHAAGATRRHAQAATSTSGAMRSARQAIDGTTQGLAQLVPGLSATLGPLRSMENVLEGLGPAAAGAGLLAVAVGALTGGVVLLGKSMSDEVEHLENVSRATGASIEDLQVLRQILKDAGVDVESLNLPLSELNRSIAQQDPLLRALGITTRDPVQALIQLAKAEEASADAASKTEINARLLGGRSRELNQVIGLLAKNFDSTSDAMDRSHAKITGDMIPAADALDAQLDSLGQDWKGLWNDMRAAAVPAADAIVRAIRSIIDEGRHIGEIPLFKFLLEQSRQAKEASKKDADEFEAAWRKAAAAQSAARPEMRRERDFFDPTAPTPEPAAVGRTEVDRRTLIGPLAPGQTNDDYLRNILRQADAQKAADEAAAKYAADLAKLAAQLQITSAQAAPLFRVLGEADRLDTARAAFERLALAEGGVSDGLREAARHAGVLAEIRIDSLIGPEVPEAIKKANDEARDLSAQIDDISRKTGRPRIEVENALQAKKDLQGILDAAQAIDALPPIEVRARVREAETERKSQELHDPEALAQARDDFRLTLEEITSEAGVMRETMQSVLGAIDEGFSTVFRDALSGAGTWASAMRAIFHALADAIVKEIARIIAAQVAASSAGKALTSFLGGLIGGIGSFVGGLFGVSKAPVGVSAAAPAVGGSGATGDRAMRDLTAELRRGVAVSAPAIAREPLPRVPGLAAAGVSAAVANRIAPALAAPPLSPRDLERALAPLLLEFRRMSARAGEVGLNGRTMDRLQRILGDGARFDSPGLANRRALAQGF